MTTYIDPCDDCTRCAGCGHPWCRAETTSPGETTDLCVDCWGTDNDTIENELLARALTTWGTGRWTS